MNRTGVIALGLFLALPLAACTPLARWMSGDDTTNDRSAAARDGGSAPSQADASTKAAGPPTITKLAFVEDPLGPRILVAGVDPAGRLESVWIDLLDENGKPAVIDGDGDGSTESSQLEILSSSMDKSADAYFFEVRASPGLERFAKRVTARVQEKSGTMGEPHGTSLAPLAVRGSGEACDLQGFDVCTDGLACNDDSTASSRCEDLDAARARRCATAPVIEVGARTRGTTKGASLWDPPDGCASEARRGRPEAVLRLRLPSPVSSLAIATLADGTTFDSVVTVLDGCGARATALACNDDDPPPVSRVRIDHLPAGDYIVVVDSLDRSGGAFELTVTAR
ncbi:MAG: hypothetical protein BGO98_26395 [Myxococcales bacterium 68-20]|nr:hypothetical protein [Myxococcales bacterium]OJY30268.1 MAG: hypothetical protein BGO98_26395 [Myxococcales bacterium 68-20]